jgi:uncharacterized protein YoxC
MNVTDPQTFFLQQGILGVIIVVLSGFIIWLFRRLDKKDEVIENRDQVIAGLQEKRVADFKDNSEKIIDTSNNLLNGLQSLKDAAGAQTNAVTKMLDNFIGREK